MSDTKPISALAHFECGVDRNAWNKPFDLDASPSPGTSAPDPESERDAAELKRLIAGERAEARAYQVELDRVSEERDAERRRLVAACTPSWADEVAPGPAEPIDPLSEESRRARERNMDERLARLWIAARSTE